MKIKVRFVQFQSRLWKIQILFIGRKFVRLVGKSNFI